MAQHIRGTGSRKQGQGSKWIRPEKRLQVYARDAFRCCYCGAAVVPGQHGNAELDHVLAVKLGGSNLEHNIVTCCQACNNAKKAKTVRGFYSYLRDRGVNTDEVGRSVRNATARKLPPKADAAAQAATVRAAARLAGQKAA